ncbi:methyl-accepting chemotaxis protein [Pseudomonas sp. GM79]|nr:methyl-accepting chemotaxis protein [Pseudomonas sp. GM79]
MADEVRQLAQRTSQSTTQIHDLITKLQTSSNNAVQTMESGHRQAQEGVTWVLEADKALVGISTHWLNGLTDNRSILMERPARGLLPALSYPPCHTFVTPTMHNAVSQKDLAPSTGSPAKCRFFSFQRHAFHEVLTERSAD